MDTHVRLTLCISNKVSFVTVIASLNFAAFDCASETFFFTCRYSFATPSIVRSRQQVMPPPKTFLSQPIKDLVPSKKVISCCVRVLFKYLTHAWDFWLSFDPERDNFHQSSHFQMALFISAILFFLALVVMGVHSRTVSACIRHQKHLTAFANPWLAHNASNQS